MLTNSIMKIADHSRKSMENFKADYAYLTTSLGLDISEIPHRSLIQSIIERRNQNILESPQRFTDLLKDSAQII